jgi:hypothetical protein
LDYWRFTYYGSKVSHVAAPAKPVIGTVTDTVTGKPIAGVVLRSSEYYVEGPPPARVGSEHATAVTDAQGRFRLDGLPRSASNPVQFLASDGNYLPFALEVDTRGNDVAPVRRDAALTAGVVVEGRVTDATTGEGIKGSLQFLPTKENPNRELARAGQVGPSDDLASSDAEGRFRIVVTPGPGYLGFTAFAREIYPFRPRPDDAHSATMFYHIGGEFHVVHNITAQAGDASMHVDLQLTPLPVISGQSLDSEGRPLENVLYVGRTDVPRWYASKSGEIKVYGYDGTTPRRMAFFHKDRKLAGIHLLRGEGQENFRVKLEPWAAIKGRIVD